MHIYVALKYNDFWATLMDKQLGLSIDTRKKYLNWGAGKFNNSIDNCKNRFLKPIIKAMKNLTELFVTPSESGNNRCIYQPIFRNKNLQLIRKPPIINKATPKVNIEKITKLFDLTKKG